MPLTSIKSYKRESQDIIEGVGDSYARADLQDLINEINGIVDSLTAGVEGKGIPDLSATITTFYERVSESAKMGERINFSYTQLFVGAGADADQLAAIPSGSGMGTLEYFCGDIDEAGTVDEFNFSASMAYKRACDKIRFTGITGSETQYEIDSTAVSTLTATFFLEDFKGNSTGIEVTEEGYELDVDNGKRNFKTWQIVRASEFPTGWLSTGT
jgi:hypothetical protein